jgi:hypothetical protein
MPRGGCVGQRRTANRQAPRFSALGTHRPVRSVVSAGPASGCSGGAAVWLDAVLAEQVVQAAEFATQPLLTGKHLLFPVAQRRGGLDVSRGERGLLLLLRPGKLVRSVREVSQDRLLDDPGLRICWPAASGQSSITRSQTRAWLAAAPVSTWAPMPRPAPTVQLAVHPSLAPLRCRVTAPA